MRRHANTLVWAGVGFIVAGFGLCTLGFGGAFDPEVAGEAESSLQWGVYAFFGGILCLAIGAFLKAFSKDD